MKAPTADVISIDMKMPLWFPGTTAMKYAAGILIIFAMIEEIIGGIAKPAPRNVPAMLCSTAMNMYDIERMRIPLLPIARTAVLSVKALSKLGPIPTL